MKIDKVDGCGEANGAYADLVIMVTSAVTNINARMAIRQTWGKFAIERGAYFYFLLGSTINPRVQAKVEAENRLYDDILQGTFIDNYYNLTLKSLTMMHWVSKYCSKIRYVMKVDDDMFVNTQHVADFSEINPNFHKVLIGRVGKKWPPHRNPLNKWYVPTDAYNETFFPNFVTGPAYFFTGDAASILYETAYNDRAPLLLEDVYLTGIVAEKAGIKRINHSLMKNTHQTVNECTFPRMMTSHKHTPKEIVALWKLVYSKKCQVRPSVKASAVVSAAKTKLQTTKSSTEQSGKKV